jgi:photosystem II stability/assembly factor-like uncharacterized protein
MRVWILGSVMWAAAALLAGCGGSNGESAPPPTNVAVTAGDARVTVTFDGVDGVDYWVFFAPGTNVTADNWFTVPGAAVVRNAKSPQVINGLRNGQAYSLAMNGRRDGGPGGSGTGTFVFTPRLAGVTWTAGTPITNVELRGAAVLGKVVVVGTGGTIQTSTDGKTFAAATSGVTTDLNDAFVSGSSTSPNFYVVGAGGTILYSGDAATWTARTSGTTANLNSFTIGASRFVAVGDNGTIVTSTDGTTFTPTTSGTTANLTRVVYSGRFVAVGTGGTVLTSTDGVTWQASTSNTTADLRAIVLTTSGWVALGSNGTNITSADSLTWTARPGIGAVNFRAAVRGNQVVAAGSNGAIYTSTDGLTWVAQNSGTTANLNALSLIVGGYLAVGAGGVNVTSL